MSDMRSWKQFTIRELLGSSVIVALCLFAGFEWMKRHELQRVLSETLPIPLVEISTPQPLADKYHVQSHVALHGRLLLPEQYRIVGPLVAEIELHGPDSIEPIMVKRENLAETKNGFVFICNDICQGAEATSGNFPVIVNMFDAGQQIASAATVVRFVEAPNK